MKDKLQRQIKPHYAVHYEHELTEPQLKFVLVLSSTVNNHNHDNSHFSQHFGPFAEIELMKHAHQ